MLMMKQLWTEYRFRKRKPGTILLILTDMIFSLLSQSWLSAIMYFWLSIDIVKKQLHREEVPEILCFLPMELSARQSYARMKGYLEGGLLGLYLIGCLLLSQISLWGNPVNWPAVPYTLLVGLDFLLHSSEQSVMEGNAGYRRLELDAFRKICCPGWYRALYRLSGILRGGILMTAFYWCVWLDKAEAASKFSWQWMLALCGSAAGLLAMHIFRMRYILSTVEMGDYNGGDREQDLDKDGEQ